MSYANMDHAAWAESNNAAGRRNHPKPKRTDGRVVGFHQAPEKLTPFQRRVIDILGMLLGGIYNAGIAWETVDWDMGGSPPGLSVVTRSMRCATFDFDHLTRFVFLCHAARIRGDISQAGPGRLRLSFWQRTAAGGMSRRHPSLLEAYEAFEDYLPEMSDVRWRSSYDEEIWHTRAVNVFNSYNKVPYDSTSKDPYFMGFLRCHIGMGSEYKVLKSMFPDGVNPPAMWAS